LYIILGTSGPSSPFLQRGRFSVIPEEQPSTPQDKQHSTTPDPDWDFDIDERNVSFSPILCKKNFLWQ
jgi:hypothetical protein